jgi:predicted component of type VI protein secretion system
MIRISVFYDGRAVTEFEQAGDGPEITIGRAPGCSVRLDEASISRLHALIRRTPEGWVLERKASFGAVLLNGQEVENARLEGGEEISIGNFVLRVDVDPVGGASRAEPAFGTAERAIAPQRGRLGTHEIRVDRGQRALSFRARIRQHDRVPHGGRRGRVRPRLELRRRAHREKGVAEAL